MSENTITVAQVDEAITKILTTGQSVQIGDMQYSQANLNALRQLRQHIIEVASRDGGKRPIFRSFNISGMGY